MGKRFTIQSCAEYIKQFKQERQKRLSLNDLKDRLDRDERSWEKEKKTFSAANISSKRQLLLKVHRLLLHTDIEGSPGAFAELKKRDPMLWDEIQVDEVFNKLKSME